MTDNNQQQPAYRFLIQHELIGNQWETAGTVEEEGVERPNSYHSFAEAVEDVYDLFDEVNRQIQEGSRDPEHGYHPSDYRILDTQTNSKYYFKNVNKVLHVKYPDGTLVDAKKLLPSKP